MHTPDLFDTPSPSGAGFHAAFEHWLAARQAAGGIREPSTVAVYRSMWQALAAWCLGRGLTPRTVTPADLEAYVQSRGQTDELSDRYVWRLLKLADEVLDPGRGPSPRGEPAAPPATGGDPPAAPRPGRARELIDGTPRWRHANASARTPLPEHLDAAQARRLVAWLLAPQGDAVPVLGALASWQSLRGRSSVALQMGAGLTPAEVRAATADGVVNRGGGRGLLPWKIRLPALGPAPEREAPIAPWAARLLRDWLATRDSLGFAGPLLYPAGRDGRPWSRVGQYNAARAVLEAAGLDAGDGGSYRLRHTFALRQLRRGSPPEEVARWLGMADATALWRHRRVLGGPVDVV